MIYPKPYSIYLRGTIGRGSGSGRLALLREGGEGGEGAGREGGGGAEGTRGGRGEGERGEGRGG